MDSVMSEFMEDQISIEQFFSNRSVFITGATGFIGKQVLEKILRSCNDINTIYVLMRSSKRHTAKERLEMLFKTPLFHRIMETNDSLINKIQLVEGDISLPNLGIHDQAINQKIFDEVSVVFHLAATVSFNEPMKVAVSLNIIGIKSMLELCKKMTKLEALVHVSTAYANCTRSYISEKIYPPPVTPKKILDSTEWMSDQMFEVLTKSLLDKHPNTYTFTKSIAESLIMEERGNLPVAIYRPSIVTATFQEPFPGWVDNLNGATGIITAIGSGFVKSVYGGGDKAADLVPVDMVANSIIAVAWDLAINKRSATEIPVYNFTSGKKCPLTWGNVGSYLTDVFRRYPLDNPTTIPKAFMTINRFTHTYFLYFEIYLRLVTIDFVRRLFGQKPRLLRIHSNVCKMMGLMEYFTSRDWEWCDDNVTRLYKSMSTQNQQTFNFDLSKIKWSTYFESYCIGIRKYTMHQDLKSLPFARKILARLFLWRRIYILCSLFVFLRFVIKRVPMASQMWRLFMSMVTSMMQKMPKFIKA